MYEKQLQYLQITSRFVNAFVTPVINSEGCWEIENILTHFLVSYFLIIFHITGLGMQAPDLYTPLLLRGQHLLDVCRGTVSAQQNSSYRVPYRCALQSVPFRRMG